MSEDSLDTDDISVDGRAGRVRRGRAHRVAVRSRASTEISPNIVRKIKPYDLLEEEELDKLEKRADEVLWKVGIEITEHPESIELLKEAGAKVEGSRVRIEGDMCREIIRNGVPSEFTQHARNEKRSVRIGGENTVLAPAYGPPFVFDLKGGRRYAAIEDFRNFVKLAYMSDSLHHSGGTVCEPVDLPVNKRHLDMVYTHMTLSDKPFMGSVTSGERAQDTVDMTKILFGEKFVGENCVVLGLINANSPLGFDKTMLDSLHVYSRNNQGCIISPFIIGGAMSPASVAAIIIQTYAEAIVGMSLTQLVRKGSPVIFGAFASTMSMQSGAPVFGMAESNLVQQAVSQLARRLGVPCRSGGGLCSSKVPDGQACYEAANSLNSTLISGVNFVLHSAGWLEGGLVMGYEKFIMDCDQLRNLIRAVQGVGLSEEDLALDAFLEIGPGGHFLGAAHTQRNFESAFLNPVLADVNSFEQWSAEGKCRIEERAHEKWTNMLENYQQPPMKEDIEGQLKEFIEEKKASMPDAQY